MSPKFCSLVFRRFLECLQTERPTSGRIDHGPDLRAPVSHTLQQPMLQFYPGTLRALGNESNFHFGDERRIKLPVRAELPRKHHPLWRLPCDDVTGLRARAILTNLIPPSTFLRFDDILF